MSLVRLETKWNIFGYEVQWESEGDPLMGFIGWGSETGLKIEGWRESRGMERERTTENRRKRIQSNQREISPQSTFTLLSIPDDIFLCVTSRKFLHHPKHFPRCGWKRKCYIESETCFSSACPSFRTGRGWREEEDEKRKRKKEVLST